jgi:hypothetical protein
MRSLSFIPWLLIALTSLAHAQQSSTCALLTTSDIEVATGAKPGTPQSSEMTVPGGPGKGGTVYTCFWPVIAQNGQVVASTARIPPGTDVKAVAKNNPGIDALRAKHYAAEDKDFGNAWCTVLTPPAGTKDGIMMSTCATVAKGTLLSITYMSPTRKLTIDQTKELLDKAVARLR